MTTGTPKAAAEKSEQVVETANREQSPKVVPAQVSGNAVEIVELNGEPPLRERVVSRVKTVATNPRVVASISSVAAIVVGVLVVRRRNAAAVEESTENTEG